MSEKHGYWLHHRIKDESMVTGWKYLPTCDCSACNHTVNIEKDVCPSCGAIMDLTAPSDAVGPDDSEE